MSRYRMYKYVLEPLEEKERWYLRIWMCDTYSPILLNCFPHISFNFRSGPSGTCESVLSLKHSQLLSLQNLLEIFKTHWFLVKNEHIAPYFSDEIDQCFADGSNMICKIRETRRLQELSIEEKCNELRDAIKIVGDISGRDIILVDDLYQSGFTMWTVAQLLKKKGAKKVLGLACVKSLRDTDNL